MRLCVVVVLAACNFNEGVLATSDAPIVRSDMMGDVPTDEPMIACSTTGLACPNSVVVAMVVCNGACWAKCQSTSQIDFYAADAACTSWGGKLAPIRDAADQACVSQMVWPGDAHWIGLEQSYSAVETYRGWSWNGDNMQLAFAAWDSGQPDDINGNENDHAEQCAMMSTIGAWHDVPCSGTLYRFSCRR